MELRDGETMVLDEHITGEFIRFGFFWSRLN